MTPKSSYVLVGLFVLLLGVALIGGILWLSTGGPPKDFDFYLVYMTESVSGLSIDAPVKYKGVNVGRVRDIRLNPDNPEEVRLLLVVQEGTPINADTRATLEVQGLTGVAHVNLSGGGTESAPLLKPRDEPYPVIETNPSLLSRLDQSVSTLLDNLIETSSRLNELLDEDNRAAVNATLGNIEQMTANLAEQTARFDALVDKLDSTLDNAGRAAADLPGLIAQIDTAAKAFDTMSNTFNDTGLALREAGEDLQGTLSAAGDDLRGFTADALPEASALVAELRVAARNLRRMSERLQADPSMILFGPPKPEPGPGE